MWVTDSFPFLPSCCITCSIHTFFLLQWPVLSSFSIPNVRVSVYLFVCVGGRMDYSRLSADPGLGRPLSQFEMEALVKKKKEGGNAGVFIIDVRDKFEVEEYGSIPFSVHVPSAEVPRAFRMSVSEFETKYRSRMPRKSDMIVFYDQRSGRAATAVEVVEKIGYKRATHFADGFANWMKRVDMTAMEDL